MGNLINDSEKIKTRIRNRMIFTNDRGMVQANEDYDSLGAKTEKTIPEKNGRAGRLPDGRKVNVRGGSTTAKNEPTHEIISQDVLQSNLDMIDNNNFVIWEPSGETLKEIFLDSLKDEQDGLIIDFRLSSNDKILRFDFGYTAILYQKQTDVVVLRFLDECGDNIFRSSFFIFNKSQLLDSVIEDSYKIVDNEDVINIVFRHEDGVISVVARSIPKVILLPNPV